MNTWDEDSLSYEFELSHSDDGLTMTLTCVACRKMNEAEFAEALREFIDHIDVLTTMGEHESMQ